MNKMVTYSVHTLYHVQVGFYILLSEIVSYALDRRSSLVLVPRALRCIMLSTTIYVAGVVEAIAGSVPMILAIILTDLATSCYWNLRGSLSHRPRSLVLLNRCSRC